MGEGKMCVKMFILSLYRNPIEAFTESGFFSISFII